MRSIGEADDVTWDDTAVTVALGVPALRLDVLRELACRTPTTVSELAEVLNCTRNGVLNHLKALERLGVVSHETMRVEGIFRPTRRYRVEPKRVQDVAWSVHDALTAGIAIPT